MTPSTGASTRSHIPADGWTQLGLLGALLAGGVLFVHLPAALWAGNVPEFSFGFGPFLALALAALAVALAAMALALKLLPDTIRRAAACLAGAVGLVWWAYGFAFVGDLRVLNGIGAPMDFETPLGLWEIPLVAAAILGLAVAILRYPLLGRRALLLLNAILAVATTATVLMAPAAFRSSDPEAMFRFSSTRNVLVVLLDGLEAKVADRVLRADPALARRFDGFRFYKDTLGVAPTTFLSMPAIHSGQIYEGQPLAAYFSDSIAHRSFLSRFTQAGYDTTLVNPVQDICPEGISSCLRTSNLQPPAARLKSEALQLLDLSLFRVSPAPVRRAIYRDGQWLFAGRFDRPDGIQRILRDNHLLDAAASRLVVAGETPVLKFFHLMSTHTPYVLERYCRTIGKSNLSHLDSQARCALLAVAKLLGRLDVLGIYDDTIALVMADHGVNPGVFGRAPDAHHAWERRAGSANPLLLFKPLDSRGALEPVTTPVSLADVGATLCAAADACTMPLGFRAGSAPALRARRFNDYRWRHEMWAEQQIDHITRYEVRGPLWEPDSWRRID